MLPLKPDIPLAVIHVFNGLRDKARERAIATGNYDELVRQQDQVQQREPGQDLEEDETSSTI